MKEEGKAPFHFHDDSSKCTCASFFSITSRLDRCAATYTRCHAGRGEEKRLSQTGRHRASGGSQAVPAAFHLAQKLLHLNVFCFSLTAKRLQIVIADDCFR